LVGVEGVCVGGEGKRMCEKGERRERKVEYGREGVFEKEENIDRIWGRNDGKEFFQIHYMLVGG